jgi:hypothetical protein
MATTFDELIQELDSGMANTELSREMRDMIKTLQSRSLEVGKAKGEISVKLKFAAENNGRVDVSYEATVKRPGPRKVSETRWIGEKGNLSESDPRQSSLPLRVPGMGTGVTEKAGA